MASGGDPRESHEEPAPSPPDADDVHPLLQMEQQQIQKRTFTNWINAQLSKRSPPTVVQDLFTDLCDGSRLLDLLEVMSGQRMKREKGGGVFKHRGDIERALNYLKNKPARLCTQIRPLDQSIADIIDGKPSTILALVWTIILHCHIEDLAGTLSLGARQASPESMGARQASPESLGAQQASPESLGARQASPESLGARQASPESLGAQQPSPESLGARQPSPESLGARQASPESLGAQQPSPESLGARQPSPESLGARQPSPESLGAQQPSPESLGAQQASPESLASLGSPLHMHSRVSAKKNLLLWVQEQCHRAGCAISVSDFSSSWRNGMPFLAILHALRPGLVDLSKATTRTNQQNLEEAFQMAEKMMHIPRLLEPRDVDIKEPDEKSIMTYVAQFLQYARNLPMTDRELMASTSQAQDVTLWLLQAHQELLDTWASTEALCYAERYQAFQEFVVSVTERQQHVLPLLPAVCQTSALSVEQQALRKAWDALAEKMEHCKAELDLGLPAPLDAVGQWLRQVEEVLAEEGDDVPDHALAAKNSRDKQGLLKASMKQINHHLHILQAFCNADQYGAILVPVHKLDEMRRRFTSIQVTTKYRRVQLEYQERQHTVLELLSQLKGKLSSWTGPYSCQEDVRVLLQDWRNAVEKQGLISQLEAALRQLRSISSSYTSRIVLAEDSQRVSGRVRELLDESFAVVEAARAAGGAMERVQSTWDSYCEGLSSLQAWSHHSQTAEVAPACLEDWGSQQARLIKEGRVLMGVTQAQCSSALAEELQQVEDQRVTMATRAHPEMSPRLLSPQATQSLVHKATDLLREPLEVSAAPLRTYRKRLQLMEKELKGLEAESLALPSQWSREAQQHLRRSLYQVREALEEAEQACEGLQHGAGELEARLAELRRWEMDAGELYRLLVRGQARGSQAPDPRIRRLISQGLRLEAQVMAEGKELEGVSVAVRGRTSIQGLSTSVMKQQVQEAVQRVQEAVRMLSSWSYSPAELVQSLSKNRTTQTSDTEIYTATQAQAPAQSYTETYTTTQAQTPAQSYTETYTTTQAQTPAQRYTGTYTTTQAQAPAQRYTGTYTTTQAQAPAQRYTGTYTTTQAQAPAQRYTGTYTTTQAQAPAQRYTGTYTTTQAQAPAQRYTGTYTTTQAQAPAQSYTGTYTTTQAQTPAQRYTETYTTTQAQTPAQSYTETYTTTQAQTPAQSYTETYTTTQAQTPAQSYTETYTTTQAQIPAQRYTETYTATQAQVPAQSYTETYTTTQAMVRRRFDQARECLQHHITEAIAICSAGRVLGLQEAQKEKLLRTLKPDLLEEFLTATEDMRAFCGPAQMREAELLSQSLRAQWEALYSDISTFSSCVPVETKRQRGNRAAMSWGAQLDAQRCGAESERARQACVTMEVSQDPKALTQPSLTHKVPASAELGRGAAKGRTEPKGTSARFESTITAEDATRPKDTEATRNAVRREDAAGAQRERRERPERALTTRDSSKDEGEPAVKVIVRLTTADQTKAKETPTIKVIKRPKDTVDETKLEDTLTTKGATGPEDALKSKSTPEPEDALESKSTLGPEDALESKSTPGPEDALESKSTPEPEDALESKSTLGPEDALESKSTPVAEVEKRHETMLYRARAQLKDCRSRVEVVQHPSDHPSSIPFDAWHLPGDSEQTQQGARPMPAGIPQGPPGSQVCQVIVRTECVERQQMAEHTVIETVPQDSENITPLMVPRDVHTITEDVPQKVQSTEQSITQKVLPTKQEVGLQPTKQEVGLQPTKQEVGLQPTKQEVGLQPTKQEVGLQPTKQVIGLQPTKQEVGLQPTKQEVGLQPTKQEVGLQSTKREVVPKGPELVKQDDVPEDVQVAKQSLTREVLSTEQDTCLRSIEQETIPWEAELPQQVSVPDKVQLSKWEAVRPEASSFRQSVLPQEVQSSAQEVMERYQSSRSSFQAQLDFNDQRLRGLFLSSPVTSADLQSLLLELQVLKQNTEALWFEYELQSAQCSQLNTAMYSVEENWTEPIQQWRGQQIRIQRRTESLSLAAGLMEPTEKQMALISERLDVFVGEPWETSSFTWMDLQKEIKELEENIQRQMDRLLNLDNEEGPVLGQLDPTDRQALSHLSEECRQRLGRMRGQLGQVDLAGQALHHFLQSLQSSEWQVLEAQGAVSPHECRSRLAGVRQSVRGIGDEASEVDCALKGARVSLAQNGVPLSCEELVVAMVQKLEEADAHSAQELRGFQGERDSHALQPRKTALQGMLLDIQEAAGREPLTELTLPAVQQRMRALTNLETQLAKHRQDIHSLQDMFAQLSPEEGGSAVEELEKQWKEAHRTVADHKVHCQTLTQLMKKFQSCRSRLDGALQRAEQAVSERASYMGKENLHRCIARVQGMQQTLSGLGDGVQELRGLCRQLQSQLRTIPACTEAPFEAEADTLVDRWLDVTEKTDVHLDSLQTGLVLWEKLQELGGEVHGWTESQLAAFTGGSRLWSQQEVAALLVEIQVQEEKLEHLHRRSFEIMQLLQSSEMPLELQVLETQLRKRMMQVKELFTSSCDALQSVAFGPAECPSLPVLSSLRVLRVPPQMPPQMPPQAQVPDGRTDVPLQEALLRASTTLSHAPRSRTKAEGLQLSDRACAAHELIGQKREQVQGGLLETAKDQTFHLHLQDSHDATKGQLFVSQQTAALKQKQLARAVCTSSEQAPPAENEGEAASLSGRQGPGFTGKKRLTNRETDNSFDKVEVWCESERLSGAQTKEADVTSEQGRLQSAISKTEAGCLPSVERRESKEISYDVEQMLCREMQQFKAESDDHDTKGEKIQYGKDKITTGTGKKEAKLGSNEKVADSEERKCKTNTAQERGTWQSVTKGTMKDVTLEGGALQAKIAHRECELTGERKTTQSEISTLEAELTADEGRLQAEIPKTESTIAFDTELTESVIEVVDVDAMADRDMLQVDLPKSDSDVTEGQSRTQTVIKISEVCFTPERDTKQDEIATAEVTVTSGSEVVEPEICRPSTESERVEFEIAKAEPEVTLDIVTLKPSIAKIEPDLRPDTDRLQTEQLKVKIDLSSDSDRVTPEKSETDTDVTPERETLLSDIPSPKADVVSGSKRIESTKRTTEVKVKTGRRRVKSKSQDVISLGELDRERQPSLSPDIKADVTSFSEREQSEIFSTESDFKPLSASVQYESHSTKVEVKPAPEIISLETPKTETEIVIE
ncbi:nesprin-2a [Brienomyrus brachyistius]|uniref:nesprin-2a n=1 Tax=Brienomyrus brachyistius TaxID=42636 RepID=UPI0020B253DB|nr:nesprin-2a [Brienomyrus brachyistius]